MTIDTTQNFVNYAGYEFSVMDQKNLVLIDSSKIGTTLKQGTGVDVLNSDVMFSLLNDPSLIPDTWKDKRVFFFGTILKFPNGKECVPYLYFNKVWNSSYLWTECGWYTNDISVILNP